ncbi:MAG: hypothetical protein AAGF33_01975 [Pseudomonadota bacterium]
MRIPGRIPARGTGRRDVRFDEKVKGALCGEQLTELLQPMRTTQPYLLVAETYS